MLITLFLKAFIKVIFFDGMIWWYCGNNCFTFAFNLNELRAVLVSASDTCYPAFQLF